MAGDQRGRDMLPRLEAKMTPQQIAQAKEHAHSLLVSAGKQLSAKAFAQ